MAPGRPVRTCLMVGTLSLCATAPSWSGPYNDSLGKCLVESTTPADKTLLVRWMFAMMALHPDVQAGSSLTPEQRSAISKDAALLFQRLVTETCVKETRAAIKYEGAGTLETSFSLLGQVAARELFTHPKVAEGLAELGKHMDEKKIKELVGTAQ